MPRAPPHRPALARPDSGGVYDPARVTQLSWCPRAFLYSGFLSHAECDHLVNLAKGRLEKSMVADNDSGKSVMSQVQTSSGTFLAKHQHHCFLRPLVHGAGFHGCHGGVARRGGTAGVAARNGRHGATAI
uniref:Prolyl 4-hydroxylase alpha subunit domain-containing protein n=1 Tax=Oryza brachyantha TaxID=4533 RepID=J3M7P7_ORYBR